MPSLGGLKSRNRKSLGNVVHSIPFLHQDQNLRDRKQRDKEKYVGTEERIEMRVKSDIKIYFNHITK